MGKKITKVIGHQLFFAKPSVWFAILKNNKVDKKYWHKSLLISLISVLTFPLQWIQYFLYNKKIKSIDLNENPPIFIVGHWRSGTTHLHYALHQDPQFGTLSNYQAFLFNVALLSRTWLKWILAPLMPPTRPQDNTQFDLSKPAEEEQPFCTLSSRSGIHSWHFPRNQSYFRKYNLFEGISKKEKRRWQKSYIKCLQNISFFNDNKRLILKNPHNTSRIKELLELFPNAKFIFIHRDPLEVFLSTQHLYKSLVNSQSLQVTSESQVTDAIKYYYKGTIGKYLNERHLIPKENLIELRYQDLLNDPITQISNIYNKLDLPNYDQARPLINQYLGSSKKYKTNNYGIKENELSGAISKELHFEQLENLTVKKEELVAQENE